MESAVGRRRPCTALRRSLFAMLFVLALLGLPAEVTSKRLKSKSGKSKGARAQKQPAGEDAAPRGTPESADSRGYSIPLQIIDGAANPGSASSGIGVNEGQCSGGSCAADDLAVANPALEQAFATYKKVHRRMLRLAAKKKTRGKARFVVFQVCCGELGNRLLGLASSLLFALLSGRALLIDWPEIQGFSGDSCSPATPSTAPGWFPIQGHAGWAFIRATGGVRRYGALFETVHGQPLLLGELLREWGVPHAAALSAPLGVTLELNNARPEPFDAVLCRDVRVVHPDVPFVVLSSNQYFAPALRRNAHHAAETAELFAAGEARGNSMFAQLLRFIARPQAALRTEIQAWATAHFAGRRVVGLQVRRQMRDRDKRGAGTSEAHEAAYWACAREEAARLDVAPRRGEGQARGERDGNETVFFLATDHAGTRDAARAALGKAVVFVDAPIDSSQRGMRTALLDLWLLGHADALVTTSGSTFGYVAHARTSITPRMVMLEKEQARAGRDWESLAWQAPRCVQAQGPEPCWHVWPMVLALQCWKGGLQEALAVFGQQNCRPWDMELFKSPDS